MGLFKSNLTYFYEMLVFISETLLKVFFVMMLCCLFSSWGFAVSCSRNSRFWKSGVAGNPRPCITDTALDTRKNKREHSAETEGILIDWAVFPLAPNIDLQLFLYLNNAGCTMLHNFSFPSLHLSPLTALVFPYLLHFSSCVLIISVCLFYVLLLFHLLRHCYSFAFSRSNFITIKRPHK